MDFKAILVATDFSECAGAALKVAKKLARQFGAKIVLLHVIQQRIVARVAEHLKVKPETLLPAFREEAQRHLDEVQKECGCDDLEVTQHGDRGHPLSGDCGDSPGPGGGFDCHRGVWPERPGAH